MMIKHGFSLEDLQLLRVIAASGSFTTAAASLHYTQSGVSRRVAQLERTLGAPIFTRLARGVRPTALGDILLGHADDLLQRFEALAEDLEATRSGTGGRLRVGSFPTANASLTPEALRRFRTGHPDVAITIAEALSSRLVDQVSAGTLDVAVVSDYPTGTLEPADTTLVPLMDDVLRVALPRTHPRAHAPQLRLADLAEDTWISASPEGVDTVLVGAASRAGFEPQITVHIASWTAKLSYVAAGFGVTIVPELLAPSIPPNIAVRSVGDDLPARHVFATLPIHPTTAAKAFVDELQATVNQATASTAEPSATT
jgi:DNA-binding transcriptional LysR family regulator